MRIKIKYKGWAFSMIKSIQHFEEVGVKNLVGTIEKFLKEPEKQAELIYGVTDSVIQLGLDIIA